MNIFIHTYAINKTYIIVPYCLFGDNVVETKPVLGEQTWKTTFFYLVTLFIVFIVIYGIAFILTN